MTRESVDSIDKTSKRINHSKLPLKSQPLLLSSFPLPSFCPLLEEAERKAKEVERQIAMVDSLTGLTNGVNTLPGHVEDIEDQRDHLFGGLS